jgi:hypothetical protein
VPASAAPFLFQRAGVGCYSRIGETVPWLGESGDRIPSVSKVRILREPKILRLRCAAVKTVKLLSEPTGVFFVPTGALGRRLE